MSLDQTGQNVQLMVEPSRNKITFYSVSHSFFMFLYQKDSRTQVYSGECQQIIWIQASMNRLAVYSYLTRYPYGHSGSGRLVMILVPDSNIHVKMKCWTRQKLTDNYQLLILWTNADKVTRQAASQPASQPAGGRQDRFSRIWRRAEYSPSQIIILSWSKEAPHVLTRAWVSGPYYPAKNAQIMWIDDQWLAGALLQEDLCPLYGMKRTL